MPELAVLAHPPQPGREPLRQDQLGQQLLGVGLDLGERGVLVAPVEVAQEVAAVDAVELQQPRRLVQRAQRVAQPLVAIEPAGRQPRVALDDVAGDQRVLEVERGDLAGRVEDLPAQPSGAVGGRLARRRLDAGVLDDRRQVDLADVRRPVEGAGIEGERGPVGGVEAVPTSPAGCRPGRSPRTRCTARTAGRTRAPARPPSAWSRASPTARPACPAAGAPAAASRPA